MSNTTIVVPVASKRVDLITNTGLVVYVPLATTTSPGIVKIGEGLLVDSNGLLELDESYIAGYTGKINVIKVNGVTQTIVDKTVDISVPTTLSQLSDDSTHRLVTDTEKATWNGKQDLITSSNKLSSSLISGLGTASVLDAGNNIGNVPIIDSTGKLSTSIIPASAITDTFVVSSQAEMLALTAQVGDVAIRTDLSKSYILKTEPASTLSNWQELLTPTDVVQSVNGKIGTVVLQLSDLAGDSTHRTVTDAEKATWNEKEVFVGTESEGDAPSTLKEEGLFFDLYSLGNMLLTVSTAGTYSLSLDKSDTEETKIYVNDTLVATSTTSGSQSISVTTTAANDVIKIENQGVWTLDNYCLGSYANNAYLTTVDFVNESKLRYIGANMFRNSRITSINIPSSVTSISAYSFKECFSLTSVTIPSSVTTINTEAFYYCSNLTSINIPSTVTKLGDRIFYYSSLPSLTIPSSVTNIGKYICGACSDLETLNVYATSSTTKITSVSDSWVYGCDATKLTIHAPSTLDATTSQTAFGQYWNYIDSTTMATTIYDL